MKVLIVGKGGREHALAWKIAGSPLVSEIHAAPGSPGMAALATCLPDIRVDTPSSDMERLRSEILRLRDFASEQGIDLTVVGPEDALAGGLVDEFTAAGLPVFGPTAAAARIETDKRFSKELMARIGVPTATHRTFTDSAEAIAYVEERGTPIVVKATGLAAGKGVAVCHRQEEAVTAVRERMVDRQFGNAGSEVVIEDFMEGEEASLFAVTDGDGFISLVPAQDHKPIFQGDRGPNTGGMGSYAPAPVMTAAMTARVEAEIVAPVLREMTRLGCPFRGVLFVGLMIVEGQPEVVEFNCRFGDPEAQVVLPLLESDLVELLLASAHGDIGKVRDGVRTGDGAAVCVVLASEGYPGSYETGKEICGLDRFDGREDVVAFHAGTELAGGKLLTAGGRVLGVTALAPGVAAAVDKVYEAVDAVSFEGKYCRPDIGHRALARL
ncbi:MAG: phosphoribosylamine--glycine ligase [Gemmatimonadetes bacterium]|nr:phosphoribosylamine--glycine ligase [Gemmatimonadota bacterium]